MPSATRPSSRSSASWTTAAPLRGWSTACSSDKSPGAGYVTVVTSYMALVGPALEQNVTLGGRARGQDRCSVIPTLRKRYGDGSEVGAHHRRGIARRGGPRAR